MAEIDTSRIAALVMGFLRVIISHNSLIVMTFLTKVNQKLVAIHALKQSSFNQPLVGKICLVRSCFRRNFRKISDDILTETELFVFGHELFEEMRVVVRVLELFAAQDFLMERNIGFNPLDHELIQSLSHLGNRL